MTPNTLPKGPENNKQSTESLNAQADRIIKEAEFKIKQAETSITSKLAKGLNKIDQSDDAQLMKNTTTLSDLFNSNNDKLATAKAKDSGLEKNIQEGNIDKKYESILKDDMNDVRFGEELRIYDELLKNLHGADKEKYTAKIAKIKAEYKQHIEEGKNPTVELTAEEKQLAREKAAREKYGIKEEDVSVNFDELDSERKIAKNDKPEEYFDDGGLIKNRKDIIAKLEGREKLSPKALAIKKYGENLIKNHITDPDKISKFYYAINDLPKEEYNTLLSGTNNIEDMVTEYEMSLDNGTYDHGDEMIASN